MCPEPVEGQIEPELVKRVPEGWSRVTYRNRPWALRRTTRIGGRGLAIFAESLDGGDFISANVYRTRDGDVLRPCEMPAEDVLDFLKHYDIDQSARA